MSVTGAKRQPRVPLEEYLDPPAGRPLVGVQGSLTAVDEQRAISFPQLPRSHAEVVTIHIN